MSLLAPAFLLRNLDLIGQVISVLLLVMFDEIVSGKIIFPTVDKLKEFIFKKSKENIKKDKYLTLAKYFGEFLTTILVIIYFFMGYLFLSEYVIVPILQRLRNILLIVTLVFFLLISWMINNKRVRKKYFKY